MGKQKMKIYIKKNPFESDMVECCINGSVTLVKRGKVTAVSRAVFELLVGCRLIDGEVKE